MCLLIPAVNDTRHGFRRNQCSTQLNNLSKAAIQYEMAKKQYPGYVNDFGTYIGTTDPSGPERKGGVYQAMLTPRGSKSLVPMPSFVLKGESL